MCEPRLIAIRAFEDFAWRRAYNRSERNGRRKLAKNSAQIAKKARIAIRRTTRCLVHTTIATGVGKLLTTLVGHARPPMVEGVGLRNGQWRSRHVRHYVGPTVAVPLFSLIVGRAPRTLPPRCDQAAALTEVRERSRWKTGPQNSSIGGSSQRDSIDPAEGLSLLNDAGTRARTLSSGFEIIEGEHTSLRWVTSTPIFGNTCRLN